MKVLFIAPLPPPITGHSLASKILYDSLTEKHEVALINLSKNSFKGGIDSLSRVYDVLKILIQVFRQKKKSEIIYLTISESIAGNIKDVLVYLLCYNKLDKLFIHLHGGTIKSQIFDKHKFLFKINKFFLKRIAGVIVLGKSHIPTFSDFISAEKLHIVPNFSQDYLFLEKNELDEKYNSLSSNRISLLFLSNMQIEKGYLDIVNAYFDLPESIKNNIEINFAGKFDNKEEELRFLDLIKNIDGITYHGVLTGHEKREILKKSHIFCLPTQFLEGQPVSIIESYSAGCFALVTLNGGIVDIFSDGVNGFSIQPNSSSICEKLVYLYNNKDIIKRIGTHNYEIAKVNFRVKDYSERLLKILG